MNYSSLLPGAVFGIASTFVAPQKSRQVVYHERGEGVPCKTRLRMAHVLRLLLLLTWAASAALSQTTIPIDSRASYLQRYDDAGALNAVPINLDSLGIKPGDELNISTVGDFSFCWPTGCPEVPATACGVFSANATLLPGYVPNRVSAATTFLGPANACVTDPTLFGSLPTDIPQDFWLDGARVRVPNGAHYLFAAIPDTYSGDNADPNGNLVIVIDKALAYIPLQVLQRLVPWESDRMTSAGLGEAMLFPSEGEMYYIGADPNEFGTKPLNRFNNGPDHMDTADSNVDGYWNEGPNGFAWKCRSQLGLSPMVEGFNAATGDHALMRPGEHLSGYETYGLNVFGYKRFGLLHESYLTLSKGGLTVKSNLVYGGAIKKWSWNGMQFLQSSYPHLGMYDLLFHDFGMMHEATDDYSHGSPIVMANNNGSVQITRTVPMQNDPYQLGGSNEVPILYRDALIGKNLTLNFMNLGPVARYQTHVTLPRKVNSSLYMPIMTVNPVLNRLWKYDAEIDTQVEVTNQTSPQDSECESYHTFEPQFNGVILSTTDTNYAIGIYAVNISQGGSVTWLSVSKQFCGDPNGNHTRMEAGRNSELPAGESAYNSYIVSGTLDDVQKMMHKLYVAGVR